MDRRHIIPVPAANDDDPVVVIEVKQIGSHPLDVRLLGCEGESPYVATLKQRSIGDLKKKGSHEEWETILSHFLLQKQPEGEEAKILEDVRMEYSPKGKNIHITIRRDVQGIKMTLGEFELKRDPNEEIDPIDWAYSSAQAYNLALKEIVQLKTRLGGEQGTIDKLNAQLQDFIKTKEETETAMLQQFMELLNEKKRKIRDQSRLLAGAKVDKTTASAIQSARAEAKPRKAGPSRASKRKAPVKAAAVEDDPDSDQMEIDQSKAEERDEESGPGGATPERATDDETEDEHDSRDDGSAAAASLPKEQSVEANHPPPRRELPFGRPAIGNKAAEKKPTPPAVDGDDETDDEEL